MPATIFSGSKVKTLKNTLSLNGAADVISSATDPTTSAVDASAGSLLLNTSNGKLYRKIDSGSSTNWSIVGTGGSGLNYIANSDAEANTTGWNTYADAAGTSPVDGTGGSASITWTRTTSSPLRGTGSFLFTKDAVNRQGQGASYDFTIDSADKAKIQVITFDYEIASGTYSDGDLTVYVYDVTGALVTQPAGFSILKLNSGVAGKHIATFQTSSASTSYRLAFHVASTSALAYSVKIDNISVGPQVVQYGAPVTDWTDYTLTIGGVTSNPTEGSGVSKTAKWRRVGDSMEILFRYEQTGAGLAGSGAYYFPIPSGYSIDASKFAVTGSSSMRTVGVGQVDTSAEGSERDAVVAVRDATSLFLKYESAGTTITAVGSSNNASLSGTIVRYSFYALVPIAGWSSNVQMSNDTDTRVVAARYKTATAQSISNSGTPVVLDLNTKEFDTHSSVTTGASWKFTAPVSGIYNVSAHYMYDTAAWTAGNRRELFLYKNGALYSELSRIEIETTASGFRDVGGSDSISLSAGDFIDVRAANTRTGGNSVLYNDAAYNYVEIERLSGPSVIAASEDVSARAHSSTTAITNAGVTIVNPTKSFDTHGAYNTSTGVFTCPVSGKYRISMSGVSSTNPTGGVSNIVSVFVRKNGSNHSLIERFTYQEAATAINPTLQGSSALIDCLAGDTLSLFSSRSAGLSGDPTLDGSSINTWVAFERVGN